MANILSWIGMSPHAVDAVDAVQIDPDALALAKKAHELRFWDDDPNNLCWVETAIRVYLAELDKKRGK